MTVLNTLSNCDAKGTDLTLYYNTGTCETPVWVEHIGMSGDLNIPETDGENELALRSRTRFVKEYIGDKTDLGVTGEQALDPLYEGFQFLNAMRANGEAGDILVLSGSIEDEGAIGWRGKMKNFDRTINGPQTGAATQTVSLKPAACTDCPVVPVKVESAGNINEYDPTVFTPYS